VRVLAKLRRIAAMAPPERRARLRAKWERWGPHGLLLQASWRLDRLAKRSHNRSYIGRADVGPRNLVVKQARLAAGGSFEQPAIQLVLAAVSFVPERSRVLEVGGGTGFFAMSAARLKQATVSCSELDAPTREWAARNRPDPRVTYCDLTLDSAQGRGFEVVVALELIEHLNAFGPFLKAMSEVAPVAILSTPNKLRDPVSAIRTVPDYDEHVLDGCRDLDDPTIRDADAPVRRGQPGASRPGARRHVGVRSPAHRRLQDAGIVGSWCTK
jgi:2-polyprenyl-3-methyl-5-hydroxy-6-metoxy-1,4-benzoquinol methylase